MKLLRTLFTLLLALALAGCDSPSGPDEEAISQMLHHPGDGHNGFRIHNIQRGDTLVSEGKNGPKGTKVFPIRIAFSYENRTRKGSRVDFNIERNFYKNEFGEWRAELK